MATFFDKQISVEKARELQKNWIENQGTAIDKAIGTTDVRDFLFDLEELQDYINVVRDQSREQGISNPGLRIYFAAYGDDQERRATIFLQATKDLKSSVQQADSFQDDEGAEDNLEIRPLNTVQGGFPPIDY